MGKTEVVPNVFRDLKSSLELLCGEAIAPKLALVERGPSVPVGKGYRSLKSNRD
jgi:hypothetical protein